MKCEWRNEVRLECFTRAELVPPAMFGEAAWDCLLALHAAEQHEPGLNRLASQISVPPPVLQRSLIELERRQLVTGQLDEKSGEVQAVLTRTGHDLLKRYLVATNALQLRH